MKKKPEILAPAGSFEALYAAVRSGADGVYFGLTEMNARRNAENFSYEDMEKAVEYCHRFGVKVYLTLNIAVKDSEFEKAVNIAKRAYLCGVDGLIVSDLGLAEYISRCFPDIELHASTQMSVNSPAALKILKDLGFCRVVPAREMSKSELSEFCREAEKLNIEVEVFVHGALCMCLSGQCLLSSVLGGRSGNRGLCAGPCRLPFKAENGTGYDLSLKDLSLLEHIEELENMGVGSFKIEGRMKRPEYIAAAVSSCRKIVDNGFISQDLSSALSSVFSRSGFTDGYFTGKTGKNMFGIRSKDDVIKSRDVFSFLHNLYRTERQSIPLKIHISVKQNEKILLSFSDGNNSVSVYGDMPSPAQNKPITEEMIKNSLSKLGGTPFYAESITVCLSEGLFVSAKTLNEIRRTAAEKLTELLIKIPKRKINEIKEEIMSLKPIPKKQKIYAEFLFLSCVPENTENIDLIILPLNEALKEYNFDTEVAVDLPRFIFNESDLKQKLVILKSKGIKKAVCGNLSAIQIANDSGFEILGGWSLNVMNTHSARVLENYNISKITVSPEILIKNAQDLNSRAEKGIFAYGNIPLMCFKNCPLKNGRSCKECNKKGYITDRLGVKFPVVCRDGYSEMFNSKPLFLGDKLSNLKSFDFLFFLFTSEKDSECEEILNKYKIGGSASFDYTRGLYYKDVM